MELKGLFQPWQCLSFAAMPYTEKASMSIYSIEKTRWEQATQTKGRRHQDGRGDSFDNRQRARGPPSRVSMHFILLTHTPCLLSTSTPLQTHHQPWKSYHQQSILRLVVFETLFPRCFQGSLACTQEPALGHAPSSCAS